MKIIQISDRRKWLLFIVYLLILTFPILVNKELVGWDLTPHLRLADKLSNDLKNVSITSYDFSWSAGYPLFSLYPPGAHLVLGAIRMISGLEYQAFATNVFLVFLCFLVIHSLYLLAREVHGKGSANFILVLSPFWLCLGPELSPFGVGIHGLIRAGLVPSIFALILFHYFVVCLLRCEKKESFIYSIYSGLLLGSILLSHSLTAFLALGIAVLFSFRLRVAKTSLIFVIGGLVSLPWALEFWRHIPFQTANAIVFLNSIPDPIFVLLPGFLPRAGQSLLNLQIETIPWKIVSIGFLGCLFIGVKDNLKKGIYFWPALWLFGFLFLTRSVFFLFTLLPLHYYRFSGALLSLSIIFACHGLSCALSTSRFKGTLSVLLLCGLLAVSIQFDFRTPANSTGNDVPSVLTQKKTKVPVFKEEAQDRNTLAELKERLQAAGNCPRVAVESSSQLLFSSGSPHSISTELVRDTCIETLPGLLSESTLTQPWILAALLPGSETLFWGVSQSQFKWMVKDSIDPSLERFRVLGVEYIVAVSERYQRSLEKYVRNGDLTKEQINNWSLYRLSHTYSRANTIEGKPILFVSGATTDRERLKSFQNYLSWMWQYDTLVSRLVILAPRASDLDGAFLSRFSRVILDTDLVMTSLDSTLNQAGIPYRRFGCSVGQSGCHIFEGLNSLATWVGESPAQVYKDAKIKIGAQNIDIQGDSGQGLLIRYGYSPRWKAKKSQILMASPAFMYLLDSTFADLSY